jgi:hypothetical protein
MTSLQPRSTARSSRDRGWRRDADALWIALERAGALGIA